MNYVMVIQVRIYIYLTTYINIILILDEFADYLNYCKSLKFEDQPDYNMLRHRFRQLFHLQNYTYDYVFDWNLLMYV